MTRIVVALLVASPLLLGSAATQPPAAADPTPNSSAATATPHKPCRNKLAQVVHAAGWRGNAARIAWAIAMRESRGQARLISSTGDYGIWQINRSAHADQPWWNTAKLLTPAYNARVAYRLSQGGRTFYPWDIDGQGRHLARYTSTTTYRAYTYWFDRYPKACR